MLQKKIIQCIGNIPLEHDQQNYILTHYSSMYSTISISEKKK